jgi:hypothetical protein
MLITRKRLIDAVKAHEVQIAAYERNERMDRGEITKLREQLAIMRGNYEELSGRHLSVVTERDMLRERLDAIAAMETPGCAHIGKKMAAKARGL